MAARSARAALSLLLAGAMLWLPIGDAWAQTVRPYALQDMRLGTPLSEFRQLRFLDPRQRARLTVICSTDAASASMEELHPFFASAAPDSVLCALFERDGQGGSPASAALEIFGERARLLLTFTPRDGDLRLSQISARCNNEHFGQVITLMRRAYGPPTDYQMSSVTTVFGDVANATYFWANDVSRIEATLMTLDLDNMTILFTYAGSKKK